MKFVLINIGELKSKINVFKHNISNDNYINEVVLSKDKLVNLIHLKNNIFNELKKKMYERNIKRKISKILTLNKEWYYILSYKVLKDKHLLEYITQILEKNGGKKYIVAGEMDNNLNKYISEYVDHNKLILQEQKILFVYKQIKNINFDIIEKYAKEYRKVNIYCIEKPTSIIVNKLAHINNNHGTSVDVIKYSKKVFMEYDVIYFVDDLRGNYPRMRIDKNSLVLDINDAKCDKYNSNVAFVNDISDNIDDIDKLNEQYGVLNIAAAIRKIIC